MYTDNTYILYILHKARKSHARSIFRPIHDQKVDETG